MLNWDQWEQACLIHSRSKSFRKKLDKANKLAMQVLEQSNNPYIAFSTGKDSTVIFHLVKDIAPDITTIYGFDDFHLKVSEEYLERISKTNEIRIRRNETKHTDWFTSNIGNIDLVDEYDCIFLGLRAQENSNRKKFLSSKGLAFFSEKHNAIYCNPIGWWSILDVWAYIFSKNRDYNRAYKIMTEHKIPFERQRIGPFAAEAAIGYGQLSILKLCFPEDYNNFIALYPQAKLYV